MKRNILTAIQIIDDNIAVLCVNMGIIDRSVGKTKDGDENFSQLKAEVWQLIYHLQELIECPDSKELDKYPEIFNNYQRLSEIFWKLAGEVRAVDRYLDEETIINPDEFLN